MLRHGYVPNSLRDCILQPIPKPGKDPSNSDNYRPIALAPTLSKVFELCILNEYRSAFLLPHFNLVLSRVSPLICALV